MKFFRIIASGVRRISRSFYGGSGESLNRSRGESPSGNQNPRGGGGSPGHSPRVGSPISGNQRSGSFVEPFPRRKMAPMANQNHFATSNQKSQKQIEKSNTESASPPIVPATVATSPQSAGEIPSQLATATASNFDSKTTKSETPPPPSSSSSSQKNTTVPLTKRLSKINLRKLKIW